jgi:hypothetical protein
VSDVAQINAIYDCERDEWTMLDVGIMPTEALPAGSR